MTDFDKMQADAENRWARSGSSHRWRPMATRKADRHEWRGLAVACMAWLAFLVMAGAIVYVIAVAPSGWRLP